MAVPKTEEQLRTDILGQLQRLGLFEEMEQIQAEGVVPRDDGNGSDDT
jgi:hypothetical protein